MAAGYKIAATHIKNKKKTQIIYNNYEKLPSLGSKTFKNIIKNLIFKF